MTKTARQRTLDTGEVVFLAVLISKVLECFMLKKFILGNFVGIKSQVKEE